MRRISPYFFGQSIDPKDVKLLFDPVEYLVFRGLIKRDCTSVEFVDHPAETKERERVQKSLERAIRAGNVEWQTFRVEQNGRIVQESTLEA